MLTTITSKLSSWDISQEITFHIANLRAGKTDTTLAAFYLISKHQMCSRNAASASRISSMLHILNVLSLSAGTFAFHLIKIINTTLAGTDLSYIM